MSRKLVLKILVTDTILILNDYYYLTYYSQVWKKIHIDQNVRLFIGLLLSWQHLCQFKILFNMTILKFESKLLSLEKSPTKVSDAVVYFRLNQTYQPFLSSYSLYSTLFFFITFITFWMFSNFNGISFWYA